MATTKKSMQTSPMLQSFDPAANRVIGEIRANTPKEVRAAVEEARKVAPEWAARTPKGRAAALRDVRHRIFENLEAIVETVSAENGKPRAEALAHDVLPSLTTMQYLEWLAPRALKPEHVGRFAGLAFGMSSRVEWRPFGVVGAITPWNYPFFLSFMAIAPALLAGNAVVSKPSEATPGVGERSARSSTRFLRACARWSRAPATSARHWWTPRSTSSASSVHPGRVGASRRRPRSTSRPS